MECNCGKKYSFESSESGIFVEIYLPKKAIFQGTLFTALTEGFRTDKIKLHFKDKKEDIEEFLMRYPDVRKYDEIFIDKFPKIFQGYSMYEVDGVFFGEGDRIYEESTQVIRLLFKPDLNEIIEKNPGKKDLIRMTVREYLMLSSKRVSSKIPSRRSDYAANSMAPAKLFHDLDKWIDYVGLFVFGYIVYQICYYMRELCNERKMDWNDAEEEIWVSSFWNLNINRVHKKGQEG